MFDLVRLDFVRRYVISEVSSDRIHAIERSSFYLYSIISSVERDVRISTRTDHGRLVSLAEASFVSASTFEFSGQGIYLISYLPNKDKRSLVFPKYFPMQLFFAWYSSVT